MDFDYLFNSEIPKGIKSVCVNGKRMSMVEFNNAKQSYLLKKAKKIES